MVNIPDGGGVGRTQDEVPCEESGIAAEVLLSSRLHSTCGIQCQPVQSEGGLALLVEDFYIHSVISCFRREMGWGSRLDRAACRSIDLLRKRSVMLCTDLFAMR